MTCRSYRGSWPSSINARCAASSSAWLVRLPSYQNLAAMDRPLTVTLALQAVRPPWVYLVSKVS